MWPIDIEQPTQSRPGDGRYLESRRVEGDRIPEAFDGYEIRRDRGRRWHAESPGHAEQHHDREHRPDNLEAGVGEGEQQHSAEYFGGVTEGQDQPSIPTIGNLARNQDQRQKRHELREADEAQVERIMRDRVDLPSHRDALHLHREG